MGHLDNPEDIAHGVLCLAADESKFSNDNEAPELQSGFMERIIITNSPEMIIPIVVDG